MGFYLLVSTVSHVIEERKTLSRGEWSQFTRHVFQLLEVSLPSSPNAGCYILDVGKGTKRRDGVALFPREKFSWWKQDIIWITVVQCFAFIFLKMIRINK